MSLCFKTYWLIKHEYINYMWLHIAVIMTCEHWAHTHPVSVNKPTAILSHWCSDTVLSKTYSNQPCTRPVVGESDTTVERHWLFRCHNHRRRIMPALEFSKLAHWLGLDRRWKLIAFNVLEETHACLLIPPHHWPVLKRAGWKEKRELVNEWINQRAHQALHSSRANLDGSSYPLIGQHVYVSLCII